MSGTVSKIAEARAKAEPDDTITFVATWGSTREHLPVGSRWTLGGHNLSWARSARARSECMTGHAR